MPLHLLPAQQPDIPTLVSLYFTTFKSPIVLALKPDVPPVREWYRRRLERDFAKAWMRVCKVVDFEGEGEDGNGEIVAFGVWSAPHAGEADGDGDGGKKDGKEGKEEDENNFPKEGDALLFKNVVANATAEEKRLMGDRKFWYIHNLATLPQHQRRGGGSMLMAEFCRQVDEKGDWGYVVASPTGKGTYERFGFETRGGFRTVLGGGVEYVDCCMVREPGGGDAGGKRKGESESFK